MPSKFLAISAMFGIAVTGLSILTQWHSVKIRLSNLDSQSQPGVIAAEILRLAIPAVLLAAFIIAMGACAS